MNRLTASVALIAVLATATAPAAAFAPAYISQGKKHQYYYYRKKYIVNYSHNNPLYESKRPI